MGLRSNISRPKRKRLDLKKKAPIQPILPPPTHTERKYRPEEVKLALMARVNPLVLDLVGRMGMSNINGLPLRIPSDEELDKILNKAPESPIEEPGEQISPSAIDYLKKLVESIIEPENGYTEEEIVYLIAEKQGVSIERAKKGTRMIIQQELIEKARVGLYYKKGSTPF